MTKDEEYELYAIQWIYYEVEEKLTCRGEKLYFRNNEPQREYLNKLVSMGLL